MAACRTRLAIAVVVALTLLAGCTQQASSLDQVMRPYVSAKEMEQVVVRAMDLIYPGQAYPLVVDPIDADPGLYADAVRILAGSGELSLPDRDQAATLLSQWWPKDDDGLLWLALTRALTAINELDRVSAGSIAPALDWAHSTLATSANNRVCCTDR